MRFNISHWLQAQFWKNDKKVQDCDIQSSNTK